MRMICVDEVPVMFYRYHRLCGLANTLGLSRKHTYVCLAKPGPPKGRHGSSLHGFGGDSPHLYNRRVSSGLSCSEACQGILPGGSLHRVGAPSSGRADAMVFGCVFLVAFVYSVFSAIRSSRIYEQNCKRAQARDDEQNQ